MTGGAPPAAPIPSPAPGRRLLPALPRGTAGRSAARRGRSVAGSPGEVRLRFASLGRTRAFLRRCPGRPCALSFPAAFPRLLAVNASPTKPEQAAPRDLFKRSLCVRMLHIRVWKHTRVSSVTKAWLEKDMTGGYRW